MYPKPGIPIQVFITAVCITFLPTAKSGDTVNLTLIPYTEQSGGTHYQDSGPVRLPGRFRYFGDSMNSLIILADGAIPFREGISKRKHDS